MTVPARSKLECVVQCTEAPGCAAANYHQDTSYCELEEGVLRLVAKNGTTALVAEDQTSKGINVPLHKL